MGIECVGKVAENWNLICSYAPNGKTLGLPFIFQMCANVKTCFYSWYSL